ncbi:SpoIID/LytB domain-containing protein [Candidatus Dependentiae bacterium]|nr:SpoIID/LytB domain-containing protein [Candidatus Dependentiae bacterium]
MKFLRIIARAILLWCSLAHALSEPVTMQEPSDGQELMTANEGPAITIRVLLQQLPLQENAELVITAPPVEDKSAELTVACSDTPTTTYTLQQPLTVALRQQELWLNRKKSKAQCIRCTTATSTIIVNKQLYHGELYLLRWRDSLLIINQLPLEEYTSSVLKTESWPGWPAAYLEIQAVISRTYALQKIMASKRAKLPYHIIASNTHQTYSGIPKSSIFAQAVKETEHLFLVQKIGKDGAISPITAMYDSCCGGVIPAKIAGVDFSTAPYLRRTKQCTYCSACKHYRWEVMLHEQELRSMLQELAPALRTIKAITIAKRDKAGLIQTVRISDGKKMVLVGAQDFYRAVKKIKSRAFTISNNKQHITFTGKGLGHQLGLCQWGAKGMLDQGFDIHGIFAFYYPGATLMKLKQINYRIQ